MTNEHELPSSWKLVRLGDICKTTSGGTPSRAHTEFYGGNIPWVKSGELCDGLINVIEETITEKGLEISSAKLFKKGTLLIALYGTTVGKLGILSRDAATNQAVCAIFTDSNLETKYLFWYLRSIRADLIDKGKGGAQPNISQGIIRDIPIPLAPIDRQRHIVAEIEKQFSRLDEAVGALKRIQINLKRYKASVLKAAVEGKLTEEWRKEHPNVEPASELLKLILAERKKKWEEDYVNKYVAAHGHAPKDDSWKKKYKESAALDTSNLPELPKGWAWATLPHLGELNRGKSKHRPRNAPHLFGGSYPFVQTGDIKSATGILRDYKQTYSDEGLKQSRLWPKGTLCITIAANIADTAILGLDACFPDSIVGFISESENVYTRFIEYFFRTTKENIERFAPATAQKNINLEILNDLAIPLPPVREQQTIINEIEKRLSVAEEIEATLETNFRRAERLRQAILKKAFSGGLVSQDYTLLHSAFEFGRRSI